MAAATDNETGLEAVYVALLEKLEGERRQQLTQRMEAPDQALQAAVEQQERELEELEQV
jgi:hypothetical protein